MELHLPQKKYRAAGWLLLGFFGFPAVLVPFGVLADGGAPWVIPPGMLCFLLAGLVTGGPMLYSSPHLRLRPEGVEVKIFFATRFYPWTDFIQAGILNHANRGTFVHHLVLLRSGGSKRRPHDTWFPVRNLGRLIYLPGTQEVRGIVKKYYGPLDFNLENGREEESFFIEEVPE